MKKFLIVLSLLLLSSPAFCADQWAKTMPAGTSLINDLDTLIGTNNEAVDRMLSKYRRGAVVQYASASTLTVTAGEVACSNSGGTVRRFRANTSATTVTWADIDTGAEASSTTYYVWALADTDATTFTVKISLSNSAPDSGTYYALLGNFYNNSSSNIEQVISDNNEPAVKISSGTIANGATIPLISGYDNTQCLTTVSLNEYTNTGCYQDSIHISVTAARVVTADDDYGCSPDPTVTANYFIVCYK